MKENRILRAYAESEFSRRYPVGAEIIPGEGVHFRVWAPDWNRVTVLIEDDGGGIAIEEELRREWNGYFSNIVKDIGSGALYRFRLDGGEICPDPASRFQPDGPAGPSEVIDPGSFRWTDADWRGITIKGQIIYEMHIGTFTKEGTFKSAANELDELKNAGISVIELMPIADFPGKFGWGYDGVDLFAPTRLYGRPDDLRAFVDAAHALGIAVILDVVYNHTGPEAGYLKKFSRYYESRTYKTDWGSAINFDGMNSAPVREFYIANAEYWISEFHLDGLRFDATQNIYDRSKPHILAEIAGRSRASAGNRSIILTAENEPQDVTLLRQNEKDVFGMDALWNDDFHHSSIAALTGHNEAYYSNHFGRPQEFVSSAKYGYLYQGQFYKWQMKRRGTPGLKIKPESLINFIQNHDQVANSARGLRIGRLAQPGRYRAFTAMLLLLPQTPFLFQGQEFASSSPFLYFADMAAGLTESVRKGRAQFLKQFPSLATPEIQTGLADPKSVDTFMASKLDLNEREKHREDYALHKDLIKMRREDPVFSSPRSGGIDGAVLGENAFVLRFFGEDNGDRLLLVNLGVDFKLEIAPEPLLAPPADAEWEFIWSSEEARYGGGGSPAPEADGVWRLQGESAAVLASKRKRR